MTKEEKEKYLRDTLLFKQFALLDAMNGTNAGKSAPEFFASLPKSLFKYRCFDEYAVEMIGNRYLYLCPAEKLDDPFECLVDMDISRFFDENRQAINKVCYKMIVDIVLGFVPEAQREHVRGLVYSCTTPQYTLNRRKALGVFMEEQGDMPGVDVPMIINNIGNFPGQFQSPDMQERLGKLIKFSMDARKVIGICSLTENPASQVMWAMYGGNYSGYCVEYDFEHSVVAAIDTFPVIYDEGRKNNVVEAVVSMFLNGLVNRLTNGAMGTDQTQYFRMFLTKSDEWSFQDEWRVIGEAGKKVSAPPIKAIYIGHKADEGNVNAILELSRVMGFKVFRTRINSSTLKIDFVAL